MMYLCTCNNNEGGKGINKYITKWEVWRALRNAEIAMLKYKTKGDNK